MFRVPKSVYAGVILLAFSLTLLGTEFRRANSGGEFAILGNIPGDQVWPTLSLSPSGGCVAWQDNVIDKNGAGIGGALLNTSFAAGARSASIGPLRAIRSIRRWRCWPMTA